jgi:hypothetical protein
MYTKMNKSYGVNEVLLASVMAAVIFAVAACQPLVIVGVTGPISVFNYTIYDIVVPSGTPYFEFMAWVCLWSLVMHWILAFTNACNGLRYVTRFPCDIFGFYVAMIYIQKGIQVLTPLGYGEPFYLSVMVALLVLGFAYGCGVIGESSLFWHWFRVFVKDYGTPLTIVFFTGFVYFGRMRQIEVETLPVTKAFFPTDPSRGWFIHFWNIEVGDVFLAIPFAVLLTILFYFDHNVSALIAQGNEFPLRKPAGFHWDLFLLGLTTGLSGLLGIPAPNGLIPQAPFHTASLCVTKMVEDDDGDGKGKGHATAVIDHVVEQRVSNLAQGLLTLICMTGPLLVVLHLIPQGVLAGLFLVMGVQALEGNGITLKLIYICKDAKMTRSDDPFRKLRRKWAIHTFVLIELLGFAATFAITQTIAAVGFPVIILLLIPFRTWIMPYWFTAEELSILDGPTASEFTMVSVGGQHGGSGLDSGSASVTEGEGEETAVSSDESLAERGEHRSDLDTMREYDIGGPQVRDFGARRRNSHASGGRSSKEHVVHHGVVGEELELRRLNKEGKSTERDRRRSGSGRSPEHEE